MKYQHPTQGFLEYPHSFGPADLDTLAAFLDTATYTVPMAETARGFYTEPDAVVIRHDVDHNLDHAVKFARWEAEHGYTSTYFVLHTAWYYADEAATRRNCELLIDLGHEVGLHNDTVASTWKAGDAMDGSALPGGHCDRAADLMRTELARMRSWGIDVVGTAAHGTPIFREHGVHNNDLWAAGYRYEDFGLEYEAYHLHRGANYLSDNRGKWTGPLALDAERQTHILIHPCHWRFD